MNDNNHLDNISIGNYISSFHKIGASFLAYHYEAYHIGFGQYQFLIQLYLEDGLSHEQLTQRVYVDKATTTRAVAKLCENGYVHINKDETDKRKYRIYLTEKANSIKSDVWKIATQWEHQLIGPLDENEILMLSKITKKIAKYNKWMNFK